ncbi:ankyrin repeat-containing protein NPR4-like [Pistacia vera]|uniref:ankyrin repeat-containing protein NPR4-like n=1 Tax=Pistacia vera TaxID=55513 RepID=UPI001262EDFD|nr:ankyrin repeat-containing protein NPR4-like [Pistacia vera]
MKDTANSCMIVATLIVTVVFAAVFTVPGGTNEESGMPLFANNLFFRIFVLADAISLAKAKNASGKTPRDILYEKTTTLKDVEEKWMKDTATSCMVVATLISILVFPAAFTMPGTKEETGTPNFIQKLSFRIFVISNAIWLVSSSCSVLTFLSILTDRYEDEDFHYVMPRKLVVGFSKLFLSIAAMMVVFCATIFIVFKDGEIWIPILVSMIASLPVILFTNQQWRLLYDVVHFQDK